MSNALSFDDDVSRRLEAMYATPDIASTRVAVFRAVAPRRGEHALDIGCGPGYLTRELAVAVGEEGRAVGVDVSDPMLSLARQRCAGLDRVSFHKSDATALAVENDAFDLACVLQVYCYVKDLDVALRELYRSLRRGGRAVILDSDYAGVVWESRDRERMRRVLDAWDAHSAWPDLPRVLPRRLRDAGFDLMRCEAVPFVTLNYHPNTYVFGLARFIREFVIKSKAVPADESDGWLSEFDTLERERAFFFAMDRFMFVVRKP